MSMLAVRPWMADPLVQIVVATLLGGIGQALIKQGVSKVGVIGGFNPKLLQAVLTPEVIAGFASYGISSLFYLMVVSKKGLSFAYPFVAANQVVVFLLAWFLFREHIPMLRFIGVIVICIGAGFIAMSK